MHYELITLNLELTRRCNLQCKFCARGHAQNIDMSEAIIDATLDQMRGQYIHCVRLNGGEPLLATKQIEYLVSGIIERHLQIDECCIFTNGSSVNKEVANSLVKLADYLTNLQQIYNPNFTSMVHPWYRVVHSNDKVHIIISQNYHDVPISKINDFMNYYNGLHANIGAGLQEILFQPDSDISKDMICLDGIARENARELIGNSLDSTQRVRKILNNFCFLEWYPDCEMPQMVKRFTKAIGVSANGNIYVGCLRPYDEVDTNPLGNVQCNNLFNCVENHCWLHPVTREMDSQREIITAMNMLKADGIGTPLYDQYKDSVDKLINTINEYEHYGVALHKAYPQLSPLHLMLLTAVQLCEQYSSVDGGISYMQFFVKNYMHKIFKDDIRAMLLTEAGRNKIVNQLSDKIQNDTIAQASLINPLRPLDIYKSARSKFVANQEAAKWARIRARWAAEGRDEHGNKIQGDKENEQ